jgi:hypothetical protein
MMPLLIWCAVQAILVARAKPLERGLFYLFWLLLSVAFTGAIVQIYGRANEQVLESLMRAYVWSYLAIAAFGLLQFLGPVFHLPGLFVVQWLVYGRVPRINGFNYEPSYFAIYLVMGWVMLIDLRVSGSRLMQGRHMKWALWMTTITLILCTSRTGWIFMMVEGILRSWPWIKRHVARMLWRVQAADLRWSFGVLRRRAVRIAFAILVLVCVGWLAYTKPDPAMLLQGTGLAGTASHSYSDRVNSFADMKDLTRLSLFCWK